MAKTYTHIELHASGRLDPTKTRMQCEAPGCPNEFIVSDSYSVIMPCWALTGDKVRHGSMCPEEQHFACSPECLRACLIECFDNHLMPLHQRLLAASTAAQVA